MTWLAVGTAGRAENPDELEIRISAGVPRRYRVLAADVPAVLAGYAAVLFNEEGDPVGDIGPSADGVMLLGAGRAGRGFVPGGTVFPVSHAAWAIPRDHLRAHYNRHDGPVDVLLAGGA